MDRLDEIDFLMETEHALTNQLERVRGRLEVLLTMGQTAVKTELKLVVDNTRERGPSA